MIFRLKANPYAVTVVLVLDEPDASLRRFLQRHFTKGRAYAEELARVEREEHMDDWNAYACGVEGGAIQVVRLKDRVTEARSIARLVHELAHTTSHILRRAGIEHFEATEEAYTYLLEYLVAEAVDRIGKAWW